MSWDIDGRRYLSFISFCLFFGHPSCSFFIPDPSFWLASPVENDFVVSSGVLMHLLFFLELNGVFIWDSHAIEVLFMIFLGSFLLNLSSPKW
jgi:hypothetical protein